MPVTTSLWSRLRHEWLADSRNGLPRDAHLARDVGLPAPEPAPWVDPMMLAFLR